MEKESEYRIRLNLDPCLTEEEIQSILDCSPDEEVTA